MPATVAEMKLYSSIMPRSRSESAFMTLLDEAEEETEGDGQLPRDAATDTGKIAQLAMKAELFDEETPSADVDNENAWHIPLVLNMTVIVEELAQLQSILDRLCQKQEEPSPSALAANAAELKAAHMKLAQIVDILITKQDDILDKLDMLLKQEMVPEQDISPEKLDTLENQDLSVEKDKAPGQEKAKDQEMAPENKMAPDHMNALDQEKGDADSLLSDFALSSYKCSTKIANQKINKEGAPMLGSTHSTPVKEIIKKDAAKYEFKRSRCQLDHLADMEKNAKEKCQAAKAG